MQVTLIFEVLFIMKSVWTFNSEKPIFDPLKGDIKTDVLIIGGGMAGILCGQMMKNAGIDCVICEADTVCSGVTAGTTAKITYHHGAIFDKMLRRYGKGITQMYVGANERALWQYRAMCEDFNCDFTVKNSYVYSVNDRAKIEREVEALNRIGYSAEFRCKTVLPFNVAGAVKIKNQAEFNPLKFAYSIAKGLRIFEHTRVIELMSDGAMTDCGKIKAQKIIVATHFPFINKYGGYFIKMYQHRSYVLALKNAASVNGMYVDEADSGLSFRNYRDLLLLGGGGHRTGRQGGSYQALREAAKRYYPKSSEICFWAAQDCITLDGIPYIGQYSKSTENLYVATGFNKWGMTSAMVAAALLTDMILGKQNEFAEAFSPSRSSMHLQLALNAIETTKSLLTPTVPRCPHLGCALKYNKAEHSWDCACHGSRFAHDGKLLDNPATGDLKRKP